MSSLVEEMQVYYARRASMYDASMGYDNPERVASLAPVISSLARQLAGRNVLEIACGPGFWTQYVSEVAASVTATDYNESTLAEARRKPMDWKKVRLVVADAYDLSNLSGDFDAAFAVDWLAHVPRSRMREFLDSLHSRLRPGARVVFCDQTPGAHSLTGMHDEEGNHVQERKLPDGSTYRVIKHFLSDDQCHALFEPFARHLSIERFEECRRLVVGYDRY